MSDWDPDSQALINPARTRPEIEWSVAMDGARISTERFAYYGLDETQHNVFFSALGIDIAPTMKGLLETWGAPCQLAVGRDGARTKLYWFLPQEDPYFIGVDFKPGEAPSYKRYRLIPPERSNEAFALLDARLHEPLKWLLKQEAFRGSGLFHLVLLSRTDPPQYTGVHVGLSPDWDGLLQGDERLRKAQLVEAFLEHLGLSEHRAVVDDLVLAPPMAWTCYLSLAVRPGGNVGGTIYTRASPVGQGEAGLTIVEPGLDGFVPRPVVIDCGLRDWPDLSVRFRWHGPERSFTQAGGWKVDYSGGAPSAASLAVISDIAKAAAQAGSPFEPVRVAAALRANPHVSEVHVGPDLRHEN